MVICCCSWAQCLLQGNSHHTNTFPHLPLQAALPATRLAAYSAAAFAVAAADIAAALTAALAHQNCPLANTRETKALANQRENEAQAAVLSAGVDYFPDCPNQ